MLFVQYVPLTLSARNRGCVALIVDTHMTLADSNTAALNVHVVGEANTIGAPVLAVPIENVPPESGEKKPFGGDTMLVTDEMPPVPGPDEVATNNPPSGEMARPLLDPAVAREVVPPDCPSRTTCTPVYAAVQKMDPLTLIAARVSLPAANDVVVSSTPFAFSTAIVQPDVVEDAPAVPGGRL